MEREIGESVCRISGQRSETEYWIKTQNGEYHKEDFESQSFNNTKLDKRGEEQVKEWNTSRIIRKSYKSQQSLIQTIMAEG